MATASNARQSPVVERGRPPCCISSVIGLILALLFGQPALAVDADATAGADRTASRLNVLFIVVDDLRPRLGCFGDVEAKTPNIDRLARGGVTFDRAYVQQAVCNASRASFLSGLRPDFTGVRDNNARLRQKRPDVALLPTHFKSHGYRSIALGKIHHWDTDGDGAWSEPVWRPYNMGPSTREYLLPESVAGMRRAVEASQKSKKPLSIDTAKGPPWESADLLNDVYPDGLTANLAVQTLRRLHDHDQPFFLAVGFLKPHLPFACPKPFWDLYDPRKLSLASFAEPPAGMPPVAFYDSEELRQYQSIPPLGQPLDESLQRKLMHGYLACTSYMDMEVGRVLDELDRLKLSESTVIVLFGDHGWHLGDTGIWGKCTNFEPATHTPLIIRVPDSAARGQHSSALVELLDLYPTLSDLCSLPRPPHLQGQSLVSLLKDPSADSRPAVFSQYTRPKGIIGYSMRTVDWRYTRWVDAADALVAEELYDARKPGGETRNLAGDPQQGSTLVNLRRQLADARQKWATQQGARRD